MEQDGVTGSGGMPGGSERAVEPAGGMTPPSEMGPPPGKTSSWPTGFGVIGIILASIGLMGGCCGVLTPFVWPAYINWLKSMDNFPEEQIQAIEAQQPPAAWAIFSGLVGLMMATILLVGAINLIRRRESGVRWCKVWAWISIPWSVVGFLVGVYFQMGAPQPAGAPPGMQYLGLAFGACIVLVLGIGFPLFMLIWFARDTVKREIEAWAAESRAVI